MHTTVSQNEKIKKIAQRNKLELVVLFGSKVHGNLNSESDMDIGVLAKAKPTHELFKTLYSDFSEIFLGENIDIRFLNDSDPMFGLEVAKSGILLYGDENEFNNFKALMNRRYVDDGKKYFPFLDEMIAN